jgi:crossover junction endodeoxyribonuclease RuvC
VKYYIGLDPGAHGAVAIVGSDGELVQYLCFQGSWKPIGNILAEYREDSVAALEKVSSRPGQGVVSVFQFGKAVGALESLLEYLQVPFILVSPAKWQSILGSFPKGESKLRAADYIRRRYPGILLTKNKKKNEGIIDALCLALFIKDNH